MTPQNLSSQDEPVIPDMPPLPDGIFYDSEPMSGAMCMNPPWSEARPYDISLFTMPLYNALAQHSYHQVLLEGPFDLNKLVNDHRQQLYRSDVSYNRHSNPSVARLLLRLADGVFVLYEHRNLVVFAPTSQAAAQVAERLRAYEKPASENKPGFRLVSLAHGMAETEFIAMNGASMDEADLALHYGDEFPTWERAWLKRVAARQSGLTLVFGPPGVGKTQWLKSLIMRFNDRFACYYLPLSSFDVLASPSFVSFWLDQNRIHSNKNKLAIIEDAEDVLLPRDENSRAKVSNLLNIGDGFLGDHLKLHIIASTNTPLQKLDPALLRPGRLTGSYHFRRLPRPHAQRLALAKGLTLPEQQDWSLAEIYNGTPQEPEFENKGRVGFVLRP